MLTKKEVKNSYAMAGISGMQLFCSDSDGEIVWACGLLPGVHSLASFARFMHDDGYQLRWDAETGDVVNVGGQRIGIQKHPMRRNTGANQTFIPERMTAAEGRMRSLFGEFVERTNEKIRRLKVKQAAKELTDDEKMQLQKEADDKQKSEKQDKEKPPEQVTPEPKNKNDDGE